jgi:hypothetical protein
MSKSKWITGSRAELFILKGWEEDRSDDYDYHPKGLHERVAVPIVLAPSLEMHSADSLESIWNFEAFADGDLPKDGEQRFFKVWFDFSTRKVLDVKCIKLETLDLVHDTYELEDPLDPDPVAKVQACFDMPENKMAFDGWERMLEGNVYFDLEVPKDVDFFILEEVRESWKAWQDFRAKTATS